MKMPISRNVAIEIISALIILLFVYTALSKLTNFVSFQYSIAQSPLLEKNVRIVAWTVPILELIISILLLLPRTRVWGFIASTCLMLLFTLYVAYLLVFIPSVPCACGGIMKTLTWPQHLFVNITYTILSAYGFWLAKTNKNRSQQNSNYLAV